MAYPKTVVGFFSSKRNAEQAVSRLVADGLPRETISVVASSERDDTPAIGPIHDVGEDTEAGRDASIGAIAGFVAGTILAVIPGIGPILAVGPITAAIAGLGVGAAAGGAIGMLKDQGVSEAEAEYYAEGIRRGGALVSVHTTSELESDVKKRLKDAGAEDVMDHVAEWRAAGWKGFDPNAGPYQRVRRAG
jgi:hypothetical protein